RALAWRDLRTFYRKRLYVPAWSDVRGPLPRAEELLRAIDATAAEGLDPRLYRPRELATLTGAAHDALAGGARSGSSPGGGSIADPAVERRIVDLDVRLTYAYLTVAEHLATGRLRPQALPVSWHTRPAPVETDAVLQAALTQDTAIADSLAAL